MHIIIIVTPVIVIAAILCYISNILLCSVQSESSDFRLKNWLFNQTLIVGAFSFMLRSESGGKKETRQVGRKGEKHLIY